MGEPSAAFRLADLAVGGALADFIRERRADGESFEAIAKSLLLRTNGAINVTGVTINNWASRYVEPQPEAEAV